MELVAWFRLEGERVEDRVGPRFEGRKGEKLVFCQVVWEADLARWVGVWKVEGGHRGGVGFFG